MDEEDKDQVREPRAPYVTADGAVVEEHAIERLQVQFPPYFDRFLEERDRRLSSELGRLEEAIEHNGAGIARLLREMEHRFTGVREEMDLRFAGAREEREALRAEMERRFVEAREEREALRTEMERRFVEAREERKLLRAEMRSQFRWTVGLLFPLVAGVLAIIIRVFFVGTF